MRLLARLGAQCVKLPQQMRFILQPLGWKSVWKHRRMSGAVEVVVEKLCCKLIWKLRRRDLSFLLLVMSALMLREQDVAL